MSKSAIITKRQSAKSGNIYYKVNIFDGSRYVWPTPEEALDFCKKKGITHVRVKE
jgi:hypothetical protein